MSAKNTPINDLLGISMEKVKEMADVNAIIGQPMKLEDGTSVIPVSKVSYGFASGGSDLPSKYDKDLFGGGAGAGVSIKPEGFLVISPDGTARMVPIEPSSDPIANVLNPYPASSTRYPATFPAEKASPQSPLRIPARHPLSSTTDS